MPGVFRVNARLEPVTRLGAGMEVLREQIHAARIGDHVGAQTIKAFRRHGVAVVPPDRRLGEPIAHDEFVLRRAAGMRAGLGDERAAGGDLGLAPPDSFFIEARGFEIAKDVWLVLERKKNGRASRIFGVISIHGGFLDCRMRSFAEPKCPE